MGIISQMPAARSTNQSVKQVQKTAAAQHLAKNRKASEDYVNKVYPNEKFLSQTAKLQTVNQWTEKLVLPKNVRLAESRIPRDKDQCDILKKELSQAEKLSRLGNSIFFTPERGSYKKRVTDAVVNGPVQDWAGFGETPGLYRKNHCLFQRREDVFLGFQQL
jgi:hypothetical protein